MNKTAVVLALAMTVSSSLYAQQFLPTKSIVNARDLGGYITEDGRKVKDHVLIRAAHLADATDKDLEFLSQMPVAKVVDFRTESDKVERADRDMAAVIFSANPLGKQLRKQR